jgi:cobalt-zinc-cadmium efflux system outer membrane protein
MSRLRSIGGLMGCVLALSGCASVDLSAGFSDVRLSVQQQLGAPLYWNNGTDLDREVDEKLKAILREKVTAERAVQIALLNNRELQAVYADLGVAQSDLVQAGLLKNPLFDAIATFPITGGRPDFELTAAMSFLDVFYSPLRKRVAVSRFAEAKSRVTGAVLDLAGRVRSAFFDYLGSEQLIELNQSIVQGLAASLDIAQRLHEAGNASDLDYARERLLLEAAKLQLRRVEIKSRQSREQLNILMGLWGDETEWRSEGRLPDIPKDEIPLQGFERMAVERSLNLAEQRRRIIAAGEQLGLNRATALIPDLDAGARGERGDGAWAVGPVLQFPIPLFDQGQARTARAAAELRRAEQEFYAMAVRVRATARMVADRLIGARDRALYYRDVVLPLHQQVVDETRLNYNAMQLGPTDWLRAREQQIGAAASYVEVLRDYWLTRSDYQQLLIGRLPQASASVATAVTRDTAAAVDVNH